MASFAQYAASRNPLYIGTWLVGLSLGVLLSPVSTALLAVLLTVRGVRCDSFSQNCVYRHLMVPVLALQSD